MNYEPFLRRCEAKFPEEKCFDSIIKKIEQVFCDDDFSESSRASQLFYISSKFGKSQFFRLKRYVKELYSWLFELGLVTEAQCEYVSSLSYNDVISDTEILQSYFKDLDSALDFVSAVSRRRNLPYEDDDDFLMIKAIVVFGWLGLDREEMCEIKKKDLIVAENAVLLHDRNPLILPERCFEDLRRLAEACEYRTIRGYLKSYAESPYLMRHYRTYQMDAVGISETLKVFNKFAADQFGKKLSVSALKNNRIFCEMIASGAGDGMTEFVKAATGLDRTHACWYKATYERWKNIFYPEEVV